MILLQICLRAFKEALKWWQRNGNILKSESKSIEAEWNLQNVQESSDIACVSRLSGIKAASGINENNLVHHVTSAFALLTFNAASIVYHQTAELKKYNRKHVGASLYHFKWNCILVW